MQTETFCDRQMISYIKRELLDKPEYIIELLERYDFYKVRIHNGEIRCAFEEGANATAIQIRLHNNNALFVKDYGRDISCDLFSYIIKTRQADFKEILQTIKQMLGISEYSYFSPSRSAFGGFYNKIKRQTHGVQAKVYPEKILQEYVYGCQMRFLRDNINYEAQEKFQIGYDIISQRITIPVRNVFGELIGVKGRIAGEPDEDEPKYMYLYPCPMSSTLFGYCQNYEYINESKTILIGESEKFVMQCYSYGIRNCVSIGSNSLSTTQCRLLMELNPERIVFLLDKDLPPEITQNNADKLRVYSRMRDLELCWWDWAKNPDLPPKSSPSDFGEEIMKRILNKEVVTCKQSGDMP